MKIKRCYIDVETTGTDPQRCAIYELAYIIEIEEEDGTISYERHGVLKIKPFDGALIEDKALSLRGFTPEDLQKK